MTTSNPSVNQGSVTIARQDYNDVMRYLLGQVAFLREIKQRLKDIEREQHRLIYAMREKHQRQKETAPAREGGAAEVEDGREPKRSRGIG